MNLKVKDILNCTHGNLIIGNSEKECVNYSKDTRTIKKGDIYIGIKGEKFDGNLFWQEALDKGADVVIINEIELKKEDIEFYNLKNKTIIQVKDTIIALGQIAKYKREMYKNKLKVIGVTGSVGKTSTKDIVASVLSRKYKTLKTEGNNNNNIGLPLTILKLQDEEVAVIEMGMNHLEEISYLSKIAKPDISIITNVGTSHIGNLGSRENILKAKLEILDGMENKILIINNDNDLLYKWNTENKEKIEIHTFGIKEKSEFQAYNIKLHEKSSEFECKVNNEILKFESPIAGEHFILNALSAIAVGNLLSVNEQDIQKGIRDFQLTKKRMEIVNLKNNVKIINDTYNASFESMKASIINLKNMKGNRKIAVLGDMLELGDYSEKLHKDVGEVVAKNKLDELYLIGNNAKYIAKGAENYGFAKNKIFYFENKEALINKLKENIKEGDIILFKASNGVKLFEVVEKIKSIFLGKSAT